MPAASGRVPRGVWILTGLALFVVTIAGMKACAGIIGPLFLALCLVITVYPVRRWFDARGWPRWIGSTVVVVCVYLILIALLLGLVMAVSRMAALAPTYAPQIKSLIAQTTVWLQSHGIEASQAHALGQSLDVGKILSLARSMVTGTFGVVMNIVLIAILVLFIGFDSDASARSLQAAGRERPAVRDALFTFARATREYFAVTAIFGLIVAVIDTVVLLFLGIPDAVVWGILAFVTNFVPNVGFVIGLIPPALVGLLGGGLDTMIGVIVAYVIINVVIQTVIQPRVVGNVMGISPTITFVSLLFWAFVLGPLGAILAIPLTLLTKAALVDITGAQWVEPLLSGRSVEDAPAKPVEGDS